MSNCCGLYKPYRSTEKLAVEAVIATAQKAVLDKYGKEELTMNKMLAEELEEEMNILLPEIAKAIVVFNDEKREAFPMICTNHPDALSDKMRDVGRWLVDNFRWSIENEGWG